MLAITRVVDKLFRIANRKDAFGENPWQDIAGYEESEVLEPVIPAGRDRQTWGGLAW